MLKHSIFYTRLGNVAGKTAEASAAVELMLANAWTSTSVWDGYKGLLWKFTYSLFLKLKITPWEQHRSKTKQALYSLTYNIHAMAWQQGKQKKISGTRYKEACLECLFCLLYTLISQVFPDSYLVKTLGYLILICYTNCSFAIKFPSVFAILLLCLTPLCTLVLTRETF